MFDYIIVSCWKYLGQILAPKHLKGPLPRSSVAQFPSVLDSPALADAYESVKRGETCPGLCKSVYSAVDQLLGYLATRVSTNMGPLTAKTTLRGVASSFGVQSCSLSQHSKEDVQETSVIHTYLLSFTCSALFDLLLQGLRYGFLTTHRETFFVKYLASSASGIRHPASGIRHPASGIRHPLHCDRPQRP